MLKGLAMGLVLLSRLGFLHRNLEGRGNLEECLGDKGW